jgi:hypothetical protein
MGRFADWRRYREETGLGGPVDLFRFNTEDGDKDIDRSDRPVDFERIRNELFKLILDKYPKESKEFIHKIADRGDEEIKMLLSRLDMTKEPEQSHEPKKYYDQDEVVPSSADGAHGYGGGGGD